MSNYNSKLVNFMFSKYHSLKLPIKNLYKVFVNVFKRNHKSSMDKKMWLEKIKNAYIT